jgi:hypothetical protein
MRGDAGLWNSSWARNKLRFVVVPIPPDLTEDRLDTLIFVLIFATLLAMRSRRRWLTLTLFLISLTATVLLFKHHVTSSLPLNF